MRKYRRAFGGHVPGVFVACNDMRKVRPHRAWLATWLLASLIVVPHAAGQDGGAASPKAGRPVFDLMLLDLRDNVGGQYAYPSMKQALLLTKSFYGVAHEALGAAAGDRLWLRILSISLFDVAATYLPPGDSWLHEEWHRSVMNSRGIGSFNDVYRFRLFAETIAVSHVKDADLIRLKRDHPADQVRLAEAGIEGQYALVTELEKDAFFRGAQQWHLTTYWLNVANSIYYVWSGATAEADELTDEMNAQDGPDVEARDFTGHDFTAWVYDLHRPDEPYEARGVHPSGVGIDRYIRYSDLSGEEQSFLRLQGRLALLNLLDPNLLGLDGWWVDDAQTWRLGAAVRHYLTSFGYAVDANAFLRRRLGLFLTAHLYRNAQRWFPGLEAEALELPLMIAGLELRLDVRSAVWMQPAAQRFRTSAAQAGYLGGLRVSLPVGRHLTIYAEAERKAAGWVAGNVHLDSATALRVGLRGGW
ncbi:MAG: hypothetical protein HYV63_10005 [Candidatus Schekmanbacteria bacterium]|nr:hypothetical protein [Candidatus Schekmanbacteria bacterium]